MATRILNDDGIELDAHFSVEPDGVGLLIRLQSKSGRPRADGTRNKDYADGLLLLLQRLGQLGATLTGAWLDSALAQRRPLAESALPLEGLPLSLAQVPNMASLRLQVGRALGGVMRAPAAKGSGNPTRALRLRVTLLDPFSAQALERRLRHPLLQSGTAASAPDSLSEHLLLPVWRLGHEQEDEPEELSLRRVSRGQGFSSDPQFNKAVELHAMGRARAVLEAEGWALEDTSAKHPYDLHATHPEREGVFVEVKGTTGAAKQVIITEGERLHAEAHPGRCRLIVVSHIQVSRASGRPIASGGELHDLKDWKPTPDTLTPISYRFRLPTAPDL